MKNKYKWMGLVACLSLAVLFAFKVESAKYAPNGLKYELVESAFVDELGFVNIPDANGILTFEAFTKYNEAGLNFAPTGSVYQYTWTKDTIANAGTDTLRLPTSLRPVFSDFLHQWSVTRTNISGTTSLAVKVENTNYPYVGSTAPTAGWASALNSANAAAATAATTATTETLNLEHSYGMNYRCVIVGAGTQSSSYVIRVLLKKKS